MKNSFLQQVFSITIFFYNLTDDNSNIRGCVRTDRRRAAEGVAHASLRERDGGMLELAIGIRGVDTFDKVYLKQYTSFTIFINTYS